MAKPCRGERILLIARLEHLAGEDFRREWLHRSEPVAFRAHTPWKAFERWDFDYLRRRIGARPAPIPEAGAASALHPRTVGELLDAIDAPNAGPVPYLHGASIPLLYPALIPDLQPMPAHLQPNRMAFAPLAGSAEHRRISRLGFPELLIGAAGAGVPWLHFDRGREHAFITQIVGRKAFALVAPEHADRLYPHATAGNRSAIGDLWNPDYARFPALRGVPVQHVELGPGETLFIPSRWWHITRGITPTVAVSFNSVTRENWGAFADYRARQQPTRLRRRLERWKLRGLGRYLDLRERIARPRPVAWGEEI